MSRGWLWRGLSVMSSTRDISGGTRGRFVPPRPRAGQMLCTARAKPVETRDAATTRQRGHSPGNAGTARATGARARSPGCPLPGVSSPGHVAAWHERAARDNNYVPRAPLVSMSVMSAPHETSVMTREGRSCHHNREQLGKLARQSGAPSGRPTGQCRLADGRIAVSGDAPRGLGHSWPTTSPPAPPSGSA
jgi:hypothetical protein